MNSENNHVVVIIRKLRCLHPDYLRILWMVHWPMIAALALVTVLAVLISVKPIFVTRIKVGVLCPHGFVADASDACPTNCPHWKLSSELQPVPG